MHDAVTLDVGGTKTPFKEFYSDPHAQIWFFHDSTDIIPKIAAAKRINEQTIIFVSSSWHISEHRARSYARTVREVQDLVGSSFDFSRNIVFLANSRDEARTLKNELPSGIEFLLVNNTCFLDENTFDIRLQPERKWRGVLNAKPMAFKRHFLSAGIGEKVFITYNTGEDDRGNAKRVNLKDYNPAAIFQGLPDLGVVEVLNQAKMGLMLSEEEGACYASTEYLLCGLPVVSTPSRGGRDEFYDELTALICEPNESSVAEAVSRVESLIETGYFAPEIIRQRTLSRIRGFRSVLVESLNEKQKRLNIACNLGDLFLQRLSESSKLKKFRNFFISDITFFS